MAAQDQPMGYPGGNSGPQETEADIHLQRLLAADVEEPFYRSLFRNIKELIHPPKLPPLEVTSKPVPVKEIWGFYGGQERRAGATSILIHVGVVALLFLVGTNKAVQQAVKQQIALIAPDLAPYKPTVKKDPGGGGGGGDRSPTPPSKGKLPKLANSGDHRSQLPAAVTAIRRGYPVFHPRGCRRCYAERRIGTNRISTRWFNAPAILRSIAKEWPS